MAYDKQAIINDALRLIEEKSIRKVSELVAYLPISHSTFYEWELDKSDELIQKINAAKIERKAKMRRKWMDSDIPALQIAAYKLEADDEERDLLITTKVNNNHVIDKLPPIELIHEVQGNESISSE